MLEVLSPLTSRVALGNHELLTLTVAVSIAPLQSRTMNAEHAILSAGVDTKYTLGLSVLR
jgi:hypothetical protein